MEIKLYPRCEIKWILFLAALLFFILTGSLLAGDTRGFNLELPNTEKSPSVTAFYESAVDPKVVNIFDVTISGTVTDQNGDPIPGATVSVPGTSTGTATDLDGKYTLSVPDNASLIFSFIGFESQTVEVGNQTTIDIVLTE
ncbi:MAG: carboxypeptidase-like regulatory domain-containing protein, partial [Cyclobacteriaceae bacterium]